jgi:hypothetical protein
MKIPSISAIFKENQQNTLVGIVGSGPTDTKTNHYMVNQLIYMVFV